MERSEIRDRSPETRERFRHCQAAVHLKRRPEIADNKHATATSEKSRSEDWKDKYFKALNEPDDLERSGSAQITRLSRDLVTVLARYRGIDATFNRALDSVSSAEAIHEDAVQTRLKALVGAVDKLAEAQTATSAVQDETATLSEGDATRLHEARDAVQTLIDHLSLPESAHARLAEITAKLQSADDDNTIRQIAKELGDFVVELVGSLQAEIAGLNSFLQRIKDRLGDMSNHIGSQESERLQAAAARTELDKSVRDGLGDLRTHMEDASDVDQLKTDIQTQLAQIDGNLATFITSESDRAHLAERKARALIGAIKELAQESEQLRGKLEHARERAVRDPLTGLPNRLAYDERMRSEHARFELQASKLSIVVLDIDKFKSINDTYGHQAGDRVLKHLARELNSQIRKQDFFGRFGGEEFVLILPDTDRTGALKLADALRRHIESCRFKHKDWPVNVTISCGIAEFGYGESIDVVFKRADEGLYAAKNNGRNRCEAL